MIRGVHALFYTPRAEALRAFFRDKFRFPYVDAGDGWLIFDAPEADIGCHPATKRFHQISFYCDDLPRTVATLRKRGVKFTKGITDEGWGLATMFKVPGGDEVLLYQPKYAKRRQRRRASVTGRRRRT